MWFLISNSSFLVWRFVILIGTGQNSAKRRSKRLLHRKSPQKQRQRIQRLHDAHDFMTLTFCSKFLDQKSVQLEDLESGWLLTSILLYTLNMMNLMLVKSKKVSRAERLQWSENWNLKGASLSFFNFQETSRESSGQLEQGGPDKHKQRAAGRHRFKLMTGESWNVSDDKYDSSFSVLEKLH